MKIKNYKALLYILICIILYSCNKKPTNDPSLDKLVIKSNLDFETNIFNIRVKF